LAGHHPVYPVAITAVDGAFRAGDDFDFEPGVVVEELDKSLTDSSGSG
jgi:hypothetical protein